ncbi:MAG: hypothetical protein AAFY71_13700 [Bacteroidota bacterium]
MSVYVGRWDCTVCGNKGNLGPETICRNCGASRPADVKFYLPSDAEEVTDDSRIKEAQSGPDWICGHCGTQNKAIHTICTSCANPKDELSNDVDLQTREYSSKEVPMDSFERERTYHPEEAQYQEKKPKRKGFIGKVTAVFAAIGAAIFGFPLLQKTVDVTVQDFRWERVVEVQHLEPVQREAWNAPAGAYNVQSFKAIKGYNRVQRGYENRQVQKRVKTGERTYVCGKIDKGNGYFVDKYCTEPIYETRTETKRVPVYDEVPIYATKYRYTIKDWVNKEPLRSSAQDHLAKWPEMPYRGNDSQNWRMGNRQQRYFVIVKEEDGETHQHEVGPTYWESLDYNQKIPAKHSIIFNFYYGLAAENADR